MITCLQAIGNTVWMDMCKPALIFSMNDMPAKANRLTMLTRIIEC